jgi:hypothetical protein
MLGPLALALLIATPVMAHVRAEACAFKSEPTVLLSEGDPHVSGSRLLQVWEEPDQSSFWSPADPAGDGYDRYVRKLVEQKVETNPVALLRASPGFINDLVVRHASRWIRPAICLEKLLIGQQHARVDLLETPTEFVAVVLRRPETSQLRVYYYTINQNWIGRMSPVTTPAQADAAAGWTVQLVIHNHSFYPSDRTLNGLLAPSQPDAHFQANFAKSHGLREARITNGIDTLRMAADTFSLFQPPE